METQLPSCVDSPYDLELINRQNGYHFFDSDTLRFFNSRIGQNIYTGRDGWYFTTSEKYDWNSPRLYTVRKMYPEGRVETIGEFQQYETSAQARRVAARLAREEHES